MVLCQKLNLCNNDFVFKGFLTQMRAKRPANFRPAGARLQAKRTQTGTRMPTSVLDSLLFRWRGQAYRLGRMSAFVASILKYFRLDATVHMTSVINEKGQTEYLLILRLPYMLPPDVVLGMQSYLRRKISSSLPVKLPAGSLIVCVTLNANACVPAENPVGSSWLAHRLIEVRSEFDEANRTPKEDEMTSSRFFRETAGDRKVRSVLGAADSVYATLEGLSNVGVKTSPR
jgi:hypothetical protein